MSVYSEAGNASLKQVIDHLRSLPADMRVKDGFSNPHSYRGYYEDLAFEPKADCAVRDMLEAAESALGTTYEGWKGGAFTMTEYTDCWLAKRGACGIPIVIPGMEKPFYSLPEAPTRGGGK
jgi:hypothetical protein